MAKKFKCNICGQTFEADSMPDKCPICMADASNIEEVVEAGAQSAPAKKGIDTNSNVYTILYAAVMVVIVAFLLAFVSSALKPTQDANVLRDTKNQILISLNIENLKGEAVDAKYDEVITDTLQTSASAPYYKANVDGVVKYVFPLKGRGLWGGLWGYISLDEDMLHAYGSYFGHESETAGLGARINERWFQKQFSGRPVLNEEGNIALTVVKAGTAAKETEIDGVTGATLTSKGVAAMVTEGLEVYGEIIKAMPCAVPDLQSEPACPQDSCAAACSEGDEDTQTNN
ncbi:MAG: FMN-binding protein [Bacteroidaceae bacterium]|nr:FMN-binding protein [Bacteroidaceae bacterium]